MIMTEVAFYFRTLSVLLCAALKVNVQDCDEAPECVKYLIFNTSVSKILLGGQVNNNRKLSFCTGV